MELLGPGFSLLTAAAEGAPAVTRSASGPAMLTSLFPFVLIFVIFYFLLIAPQRKQQKETEKMLGALKRGDRVVTSGGLHGTVVDFREAYRTVVLEVFPGVKLTYDRKAIGALRRDATPPTPAK